MKRTDKSQDDSNILFTKRKITPVIIDTTGSRIIFFIIIYIFTVYNNIPNNIHDFHSNCPMIPNTATEEIQQTLVCTKIKRQHIKGMAIDKDKPFVS